MGGDRQKALKELEALREENEDLKEELHAQREQALTKVSNANRIYEENAVLEKQLKVKMDKNDELLRENNALRAKLIQGSAWAAAAASNAGFEGINDNNGNNNNNNNNRF